MALAKRKPEPASAPDLGGEILRLRGEIEAFIDGRVAELKRSADGASQPAESLRQMLTHGSGCLCAVALNIMERENV